MNRQKLGATARTILSESTAGWQQQHIQLAIDLANAVLAREDDSPITPEWLAEVGATYGYGEWHLHLDHAIAVSKWKDIWSIYLHRQLLVRNATRRHVLLAMELFGIEPK